MVFEDRVAKYPGRWTMVKSDGTSEIVTLIRNDEPVKEGTPINAATLNELSTVAGAINAKEEAVSAASSANSAATSAAQSAQSASVDATNAGNSAASAKAEADRAAAIVSTDKTLSVEGAPADAKAVGDAVKNIKLPVATATTLGGIKSGKGLKISADGTASIDAYNTAETDSLLNALQKQVDRKISSAISSATSITLPVMAISVFPMAHRFAGSNSANGLARNTIPIFSFLCHLLTQIMVPVMLLARA